MSAEAPCTRLGVEEKRPRRVRGVENRKGQTYRIFRGGGTSLHPGREYRVAGPGLFLFPIGGGYQKTPFPFSGIQESDLTHSVNTGICLASVIACGYKVSAAPMGSSNGPPFGGPERKVSVTDS